MKTVEAAVRLVVGMALLASLPARAATTNVAPMEVLLAVADNSAETNANGWTLNKIGKYPSAPVLQFNANDDWILSPDFGAPILGMEFSVRCTSTATRRLVIVDESASESGKENEYKFLLCAENNKDELQRFDFKPEERFSRFKLKINSEGGSSGNWGVGGLKIVFDFDAPSNLYVAKNGGDMCRLSWENGVGTVSNRVDAFLLERGAGEVPLLQTDFETFSAKGSVVRMDSSLPELNPLLSGTNVYAYVNTNGICRLGKDDALGILRWAGVDDYANVLLRMTAKKYQGDNAETMVASEWNGETNIIRTLTLTDEFADYIVDLSCDENGKATLGGAAILVGYHTSKNKRRVVLDRMSIVRTHPDTLTSVDSRWIPAAPGAASFSTKDYGIKLLPKSEYRFEVRSKTSGILVSDPAAVDVVLDSLPGFRFILR